MVNPIVVIPGFGGSLLVNSKHPTKKMFHREVIYNRWLNIHPYSPAYMMEWKKDMKCDFIVDNHNRFIGYTNYNHDIQPHDMYGIEGIQNLVGDFELLPKNQQDFFESQFRYRYFYELNQTLLKHKYVPKDSLLGLPWDFRLILDPSIRKKLFTKWRKKIEEVVVKHNMPVTVITHSLGGVLFKWFVEEASPEWYTTNIKHVVLMNAPFGGTPSAVKAILVGDYYLPFLNRFFIDELRINSSIIMGLPNELCYSKEELFWKDDLNDKSSINVQKLLSSNSNIGFKLWRDMYEPYISAIGNPCPIKTTIFNSTNVQTPSIFYAKSMNDIPYKTEFTNGDGMIPERSLEVSKKVFPNHTYIELKQVGHSEVISHQTFLEYVEDTLL